MIKTVNFSLVLLQCTCIHVSSFLLSNLGSNPVCAEFYSFVKKPNTGEYLKSRSQVRFIYDSDVTRITSMCLAKQDASHTEEFRAVELVCCLELQ